MTAPRRGFEVRRRIGAWLDRSGWLTSRSRFTIGVRMVLGVVIALIGLYIGATRNPLGYALMIVGVFMALLFWRVGLSAKRERR